MDFSRPGVPRAWPPHSAESPEPQERGLACSEPAGAAYAQGCGAHVCTHHPELGPAAGYELAGAEAALGH